MPSVVIETLSDIAKIPQEEQAKLLEYLPEWLAKQKDVDELQGILDSIIESAGGERGAMQCKRTLVWEW